jgi:hypothetical protein
LGISARYFLKNLELISHISLGPFVKNYHDYDHKNPKKLILDEGTYQHALSEAELYIKRIDCIVDKLNLIETDDNFTTMKSIKQLIIE